MPRTKEIDGEWAGSNFLVFSKGPLTSPTLQGSSYTPQLPLQEVNEYIDIWGPHFRSRTSILLTRSMLPNILLRTKNDKHKQRVFRCSEHKFAYLTPILRRTFSGLIGFWSFGKQWKQAKRCDGEKVLTGLRDSCHSQAVRKSMPSKFSSYQGVF